MSNPVLVEVLRGGHVESRHRGAVAVFDADGKAMLEIGDTQRPVFPRSAVKSIQALPFVETGAADAYGFGDRELALACASHNGEVGHVELARAMLAKAGLDVEALECGAHWPSYQKATIELARSGGTANALHNNCSGKHTGFLCACCHGGIEHRGYVRADHAYQEMLRGALEDVTGAAHNADNRGTDGCSIPTYAVPLRNLARGFARMATGVGLGQERAKAATRLFAACMAEPFYVGGTDRFDTRLMNVAKGRVFTKVGAEGVFCAAVPELGLGIALKCDDGASRAAEVTVAAVIARLLKGDALADEIAEFTRPRLTNWNGIEVGGLRPAGELA
ncbi:asparaginase [Pseudaminobacter salicylatoxidans]|uniref:Asparaginase n=1 Tax=Pseudaminobacter salicylatoxidans TaxID=93369 RepID=A0A316C6N4_PSESE|nr:asparaginase [Pseudaminobacter salicylatoxidans]PWJ85369.1 asparaginase [Pseudaminobacter salicylatoxidans]